MAKDAKGHGSEKRGGVMPSRPATQSEYVQRQRDEDRAAASALAAPGHPKSVAAPVHGAMDTQARWGNSVMKGFGVNSPAMMKARGDFPITLIGDPGHAKAQKATINKLLRR